MTDPYKALGVGRSASQDEIRKAFKALARKYHPDRNQKPGAEERFKEASQAYEVIGDAKKRKLWDDFGEASLQSGFDPEHARHARNPFTGGASFDDFFSSFFTTGGQRGQQARPGPGPGAGTGAGPRRGGPRPDDGTRSQTWSRPPPRPRSAPGADLKAETRVPLIVAIQGGEVTVDLERPKPGSAGRKLPCSTCRGTGRQTIRQFGMEATIRCENCGGNGEVPAGGAADTERVSLKVRIPPGVTEGQSLRLRGQGAKGIGGAPDGDLVLVIHVQEDPRLTREGRDLLLEVPITFGEAIRGARIEVNTPSGRFKVKVPPMAQNGSRLRLRSKGIAGTGVEGPGDLYLVLRPQLPEESSEELTELADRLEPLYEGKVREGLDFPAPNS